MLLTNNNLNEFRLLPIGGLIPYKSDRALFLGDGGEVPLFSSQKIETLVINRCNSSQTTSKIGNTIDSIIRNKQLIVGYTTPNKFSFLFNRIWRIIGLKSDFILGYFDPFNNNIKIILDDNVDLLGSDIENIENIIAHELCHMATFQNDETSIIESCYSNFIYPYYINMIRMAINILNKKEIITTKFSELNLNETGLKILVKNLVTEVEMSKSDIIIKSKKAFKFWNEFFINYTNINPNDSDLIVQFLFSPYIIGYLQHIDIKFPLDKKIIKHKNYASALLFYSYKKIGITDNLPGTLPGQELIFPSEIIAISNQRGIHSKVAIAINKIKIG